MPLNEKLTLAIASDLNVDPSFIEKDWYATKVMAVVNAISNEQIRPVFCGGTSLSKCFGLLERFSEDLDYRGVADENVKPSKGAKSRYRKDIIAAINEIEGLTVDLNSVDSGGNYFKLDIDYDKQFDVPDSLRQKLKIEFSYTQPKHLSGFEMRDTPSFVSSYQNETPSFQTECVSPVETAADKLSALIWRVLKRDRSSDKDDPSIVRHLHDLYALRGEISKDKALFLTLVDASFEVDSSTLARNVGGSIADAAMSAFQMIEDSEYSAEYQRYVESMSFADEPIQFEEALNHFKALAITLRSSSDDNDDGSNSPK